MEKSTRTFDSVHVLFFNWNDPYRREMKSCLVSRFRVDGFLATGGNFFHYGSIILDFIASGSAACGFGRTLMANSGRTETGNALPRISIRRALLLPPRNIWGARLITSFNHSQSRNRIPIWTDQFGMSRGLFIREPVNFEWFRETKENLASIEWSVRRCD